MFHLAYRIVENEKDAGYLCIEEQTYKIIAWSKADVIKLAQNRLIFGCNVKGGNLVAANGYRGIGAVNERKIKMSDIKQYIRYKNGLCSAIIKGISVKNSEVRILIEFKLANCSSEHGVIKAVRENSDAIRKTGGNITVSANDSRFIIVNCNTAQMTEILARDACDIRYSEPNMIMKSTAPADWKRKCCEWFRVYTAAIDGVSHEVKRNPYAKVVSPTILYKKFPQCKGNMQYVVRELYAKGMVTACVNA